MRYRVTVRDACMELRGYVDGEDVLSTVVDDMHPAVVIASPAATDWNPWPISDPDNPPTIQKSVDIIEQIARESATIDDFIREMAGIHFGQATVIRGERGRAEQAEAELTQRELHHFETEQENARLREVVAEFCDIQGHQWRPKMHGRHCQRCETFEAT